LLLNRPLRALRSFCKFAEPFGQSLTLGTGVGLDRLEVPVAEVAPHEVVEGLGVALNW
jgi:hypothetical protein